METSWLHYRDQVWQHFLRCGYYRTYTRNLHQREHQVCQELPGVVYIQPQCSPGFYIRLGSTYWEELGLTEADIRTPPTLHHDNALHLPA